jgi:hypothetical protein
VLHDQLSQIHVLEPEAHVRLVVAVAAHRVGELHPGEPPARVLLVEVDSEHAGEQLEQEPFDHAEDVVLVDEAHLDVDLGELGLAIEAQVLVTKALHDLEVAIVARDHQQLLEQLRALGERVERAGLVARRDEEVARAAGRVLQQVRRLDLEEAVAVEVLARDRHHLRARDQGALQLWASQVEVAMLEPLVLVRVDRVFDREGRCLALVEDRGFLDDDLDVTGREARVLHLAAAADLASDADDPLAAGLVAEIERGLIDGGVEHQLHEAAAIAQVDEDTAAVIAPALNPAEEHDVLVELLRA